MSTTGSIPVSLIQDEHFNAAQVEGGAVVQVVDEPARCGNEDVRCCPKSSFLRLHIQATCREQTPGDGLVIHSSVLPSRAQAKHRTHREQDKTSFSMKQMHSLHSG